MAYDRSQVLQGLDCCLKNNILEEFCPECPYVKYGNQCMDRMMSEAKELLSPRVMTIDEVLDPDWLDAIYAEGIDRPGYCPPVRIFGCGDNLELHRILAAPESVHKRDYGRTWRCWTQRPTGEQSKAVAWHE